MQPIPRPVEIALGCMLAAAATVMFTVDYLRWHASGKPIWRR